MNELPRIFRTFGAQSLHAIVVPLFFFAFVLIYRPLGIMETLEVGYAPASVHLTILSCILLGSMAATRGLLYALRDRIAPLAYGGWCLAETAVAAFFAGLYLWLVCGRADPYFTVVARCYGWIFPAALFPYGFLTLWLLLADRMRPTPESDEGAKLRFYDERRNLKLTVAVSSVLYIEAEENYVKIFYTEGDRVRDYVVRSSMKAIEGVCASGGLLRCHRSYYLNPARVKVLRKGREGAIAAELDAGGVKSVPVTKRYYEAVAERI